MIRFRNIDLNNILFNIYQTFDDIILCVLFHLRGFKLFLQLLFIIIFYKIYYTTTCAKSNSMFKFQFFKRKFEQCIYVF